MTDTDKSLVQILNDLHSKVLVPFEHWADALPDEKEARYLQDVEEISDRLIEAKEAIAQLIGDSLLFDLYEDLK